MEAITNIEAISAINETMSATWVNNRVETQKLNFAEMVSAGMETVDQQLQTNQLELNKLAQGNTADLHQVMMRLEESRLSFQLMLQVRNRLLESYQDIMKMQI